MTKLKDLYNYIFNIPTSTLHRKIYEGKDGKREIDFTVNTYPRLTGDMTQRVDTTDVYNYNPATNAVTIIPNMSDSSNVMYIPSYDARSGEMWLVLPMQNLSSRNRAILVTRNLMSEATNKQNTTKKQIGGTMNYATSLQEGGQATSKKDQLKALVMEALQNAGSEEEINSIMSQLQEMAQLDTDAAEVFQELVEAMLTQSMKCGGKVRAKKVKKGSDGISLNNTQKLLLGAKCGGKVKKSKKYSKGGEITLDFSMIDFDKCGGKVKKKVKKAETGIQLSKGAHKQTWSKSSSSTTIFGNGGHTCPCQLKKVGGKIITVDSCTGLPMKKNGGNIKKFENPFDVLKYDDSGNLLKGQKINMQIGGGKDLHNYTSNRNFYVDTNGNNALYYRNNGKIYRMSNGNRGWNNSNYFNTDNMEEVSLDQLGAGAKAYYSSLDANGKIGNKFTLGEDTYTVNANGDIMYSNSNGNNSRKVSANLLTDNAARWYNMYSAQQQAARNTVKQNPSDSIVPNGYNQVGPNQYMSPTGETFNLVDGKLVSANQKINTRSTPAFGSQEWENGLKAQQKENLRRLKLMHEAGMQLRGRNNGMDAIWGTDGENSSEAQWQKYLLTHNPDGTLKLNPAPSPTQSSWSSGTKDDFNNWMNNYFKNFGNNTIKPEPATTGWQSGVGTGDPSANLNFQDWMNNYFKNSGQVANDKIAVGVNQNQNIKDYNHSQYVNSWIDASQNARVSNDPLSEQRFNTTGNRMMKDYNLMASYNNGENGADMNAAMDYMKNNGYSLGDRIRGRRILNSYQAPQYKRPTDILSYNQSLVTYNHISDLQLNQLAQNAYSLIK